MLIKKSRKKITKESIKELFWYLYRNLKAANRVVYSPYFYMVISFLMGFLVITQFTTVKTKPENPILFFESLNQVKQDSLTENENLKKQKNDLEQVVLAQSESVNAGLKKGKDQNSQKLADQEALFGLTPLVGQGVKIVISDGSSQVQDEREKSLTHAADLRDIVNLLWYAGAEAISINDERIIFDTSIDCIVSTILINTKNYTPPFTIYAIGNKYDLYSVLTNSRKLEDIKKRATKKQINLSIEKSDTLRVEKYQGYHLAG